MFINDPKTEAIIMIGEIGGSDEEAAAHYLNLACQSQSYLLLQGVLASWSPYGTCGCCHFRQGGADTKIKTLQDAGVVVAPSPAVIGETLYSA